MAAKLQQVKIKIPDDIDPSDRDDLGQEIVEFIRKRSERGLDKNNKPFPKYSKSYIESLDFKIAGKTKSQINLTLSGDMLIALDVIKTRRGEIVIGYEKGDENDRADGNIRGTYGSDTASRKKARNFLGITKDDLNDILEKYTED